MNLLTLHKCFPYRFESFERSMVERPVFCSTIHCKCVANSSKTPCIVLNNPKLRHLSMLLYSNFNPQEVETSCIKKVIGRLISYWSIFHIYFVNTSLFTYIYFCSHFENWLEWWAKHRKLWVTNGQLDTIAGWECQVYNAKPSWIVTIENNY